MKGLKNDMDWTAERGLSLTDVLLGGKLLELATSRARSSFATRLASRLNENAEPTDIADWIVEQSEVVELHASDEELLAAMVSVSAPLSAKAIASPSDTDDSGPPA